MVLGMPIYGRAFLNTDGPGRPYNGVGAPEPGSWEAGTWDYKVLPRPGAQEFFDPSLIANWNYNTGKQIMIIYDMLECKRRKIEYLKEKGLRGAMWWENNTDKTGGGSLMKTVASALGGGDFGGLDQNKNLLNYPQFKYDNLRR
jgi:chitinase